MMTKIEWSWDGLRCGVSARGHAGFHPGNDIVCSAVSALLQTLYAGLELQCFCPCEVHSASGEYDLDCTIEGKAEAAKALFDSILYGLGLIAKNYPEYVAVERVKRP